jgi:hypothetical protein
MTDESLPPGVPPTGLPHALANLTGQVRAIAEVTTAAVGSEPAGSAATVRTQWQVFVGQHKCLWQDQ